MPGPESTRRLAIEAVDRVEASRSDAAAARFNLLPAARIVSLAHTFPLDMTRRDISRASPSGKRLFPSNAAGLLSWDVSQGPRVFELYPAGHVPGIYTFSVAIIPLGGGTGTVSFAISYDLYGVGLFSQLITNLNVASEFIAPRNFVSAGTRAVIITATPSGVTGAPRVYANFPVEFIVNLMPADTPVLS